MDRDEYDRKHRKTPGSLPSGDVPIQPAGEVVLPTDADDRELRRQVEEAGYDYEGAEAWATFMKRMGRR